MATEENSVIFKLETQGIASVMSDINKVVKTINGIADSFGSMASAIESSIKSSVSNTNGAIASMVRNAKAGAASVANSFASVSKQSAYSWQMPFVWRGNTPFRNNGALGFRFAHRNDAVRPMQSYQWSSGFHPYVNQGSGFDRQRYAFRWMASASGHRQPLMLGYSSSDWHGSNIPGDNFTMGSVTQDPDTMARSHARAERLRRQQHRNNSMAVTPYVAPPRYDVVPVDPYEIAPYINRNRTSSNYSGGNSSGGGNTFSGIGSIISTINPYLRAAHAISHTLSGIRMLGRLASRFINIMPTDYEVPATISGLNYNRIFNEGGAIDRMTSLGLSFARFGGGFNNGWRSAGSLAANITSTLQSMRVGGGGGNLMQAALMYGLNLGGSGRGGLATTNEMLKNIALTMERLTDEEKIHFAKLIGLTDQQYMAMKDGWERFEAQNRAMELFTKGIESETLAQAIKKQNVIDAQVESLRSEGGNLNAEYLAPLRRYYGKLDRNINMASNDIMRMAMSSDSGIIRMAAPIIGAVGGGLMGILDAIALPFTGEGVTPLFRAKQLETHEMKNGQWIRRTESKVEGAKSAAESIKNINQVSQGASGSEGAGSTVNGNSIPISFGNITINANAIDPSDLTVEVTEKLLEEVAYTFRNNFGTPFKGGIA